MKQLSQHWFKLVTLVLLVVIIVAVALQMNGKGKPAPLKSYKQAADFQLTSIEGENVSLQSTDGKARLIYFFYTSCPDVCYPTTLFLSKVQDILAVKGEFAKTASILSVTFDPKRDTVERLKAFSGQYHPDYSGWKFLRGEEEATKELAKAYGAAVVKDNKGNFVTHTNSIVLIDKKGVIRRYYNANDLELTPKQIASDMQLLIDEQ
jgi:protein SCO1/2